MAQRNSPQQFAEVEQRIRESCTANPSLYALQNHVSAIAKDLAADDMFDVEGESFRLSDRVWTSWLNSKAAEKYLP